MKIKYDKEVDVLYIELSKSKVSKTVEKTRDVLIDFDERGNAVGIEVLNYSRAVSPKERLEVSVGPKKILIPA